MKHTLISILFIVSFAASSAAQWRDIGQGNPDGGSYIFGLDLAMCTHDSCIFLSGVQYDNTAPLIFRYTASRGWVPADTGISHSQGVVQTFATVGRYIFAGMQNNQGISYRSSDEGSNWQVNGGSPIASNGIYLYSTSSTTAYRSTDSGKDWEPVPGPAASVFAATGPCVFLTNNNGTYRSTDSGSHWSQITSLPTGLSIGAFASMDTQLFAGGSGLFRSTDSGQNWKSFGLQNRTVNALVTYKNYLFAGTDSGVFISIDSGVIWRDVSDGMGAWQKNNPDVYLLTVLDTLLFADVYAGTDANTGLEYGYLTNRPISEMTDTTDSTKGAVHEVTMADSVGIYPNPAMGQVTVSSTGLIFSIHITSIVGTDVLTLSDINQSSISLDLSSQPTGTYFVQIQTVFGTVLKKVTIER